MAEIPVRDLTGAQVDTVTVSDEVFAARVHPALMHQAVRTLLLAQRVGTHKAKSRGEVTASTAKPWRQKGTGRARQGSASSPLWRGGGVAFPPTLRRHRIKLPRKMRRQATRSALTSRLLDSAIVVVSSLQPETPKTSVMAAALKSLDVKGKVLIVDGKLSPETKRASRNIEDVDVTTGATLNIVDVLHHDTLLFSVQGIKDVERTLLDAGA